MDLAIYAFGITIGFFCSLASVFGIRVFLKNSRSLVMKWIFACVLSFLLGGFVGGVYFSIDVGTIPGVDNSMAMATIVSSCSGAFFTSTLGFFRILLYFVLKK